MLEHAAEPFTNDLFSAHEYPLGSCFVFNARMNSDVPAFVNTGENWCHRVAHISPLMVRATDSLEWRECDCSLTGNTFTKPGDGENTQFGDSCCKC